MDMNSLTAAMRARIRELATPARDDFDIAVIALLDDTEWQPTETAPRDGSTFLAFTADFEHGIAFNKCVQEAKWSGKTPDDRIGHLQSRNGQIVLYWMPLPREPFTEGP